MDFLFGRKKTAVASEPIEEENEQEKEDIEKVVEDEVQEEDEDEFVDDEDEDEDEIKGLLLQPEWRPPKIRNAKAPHPLTVTHVNQSMDLLKINDANQLRSADSQSSEEWMKMHSIEYMKLTVKDLVDKGKVGNMQPDLGTGKAVQRIQFDAYDVNEFECKLNMAIEMYTKRIKWLLQGSRRVFGNVKGHRTAVILDCSDANTGFGRLTAFQESLMHFLDEQISKKEGLYLMMFGSEEEPVWPCVRDVNCRIIEEAKEFVMRTKPRGGCNLLKAMKHVYRLKDIDSIVLILGSVPDQPSEILCDFIYQMAVGRDIPLHTVAYDCSNHLTNITLRNLSEASGGRYHCYTGSCEEQIYTGTDISLILKEVQNAQDVINKIKEMRQGMMGSALVTIMDEISNEVSKLPQSRFLPRPPGHEAPLTIEEPKFLPRGSEDWIKKHGLKGKKLDLYQVLAPNAYAFREEFIPVIKKAVQSQVHENAMVQFQWHDGSIKNVHVDMTQLFEYQKQLAACVSLFEKRIDWLSTSSRRIFGTLTEKNIIILIDLSVSNVNYLVHIQHSLRLLLEQQISNKEYFNIIGFGSVPVAWKPTMVRPTPENLQSAWSWILELQCGGSRNFMAAYRLAVENEEEYKHDLSVGGVYLFSSGVPDQMQDVICSYIEESSAGRGIKLHTVLFNVDDYDAHGAIPGRYANITRTAECLRIMAHCSGGRFHWFRETGIIESDDIQLITAEIDKALNFSRKCAMLVDSVKKKYKNKFQHPYMDEIRALPAPEYIEKLRGISSEHQKQTALSQARQDYLDSQKYKEKEPSLKALMWRPSSASGYRDTASAFIKPPPVHRPCSAKDPMLRVKRPKKVITSSFFLEDKKHATGTVFNKYPSVKSVRKGMGQASIPESEEVMTTKEWMRFYSLSRMKLDLNKLVTGPDCKHEESSVKALQKNVSAKYCSIFPSVNVKGTIKHLQLLPHELKEYEKQCEKVLRRYLKRLQWLLSGSRRVFGTVVHKRCIFLIDTSGSMDPCLDELKKEIASLVWEQLYKIKAQFNLIRFSGMCEKWRGSLVAATQDNCHDAVQWTSRFVAGGNTCTLDALKQAFEHNDIDAVYMLSDGKPDTSTSLVLREVANLNMDKNIPVNTISFNCNDSTANNFLKLLAAETGGRYHRCQDNFDAQLFAHKLLTEGFKDTETAVYDPHWKKLFELIPYPHLPEFEGDDLKRLCTEISSARKYLALSRHYRELYEVKSSEKQTETCSKAHTHTTVQTPYVTRPRSSSRNRDKITLQTVP